MAYEFTFLICAVIAFVFLKAKKKQFHLLKEKDRGMAAVFETTGNFLCFCDGKKRHYCRSSYCFVQRLFCAVVTNIFKGETDTAAILNLCGSHDGNCNAGPV